MLTLLAQDGKETFGSVIALRLANTGKRLVEIWASCFISNTIPQLLPPVVPVPYIRSVLSKMIPDMGSPPFPPPGKSISSRVLNERRDLGIGAKACDFGQTATGLLSTEHQIRLQVGPRSRGQRRNEIFFELPGHHAGRQVKRINPAFIISHLTFRAVEAGMLHVRWDVG
jgi:hypothetical protein